MGNQKEDRVREPEGTEVLVEGCFKGYTSVDIVLFERGLFEGYKGIDAGYTSVVDIVIDAGSYTSV